MYTMRVPSGDQAGARSSSSLYVSRTGLPDPSAFITYISAEVSGSWNGPALRLMNTIFVPSGDQSGSSSIVDGLCVRLVGGTPATRSSTSAMNTSLSAVAAPGSPLIGSPVPEAEAWKVMLWPSGDQLAELPRTRYVTSLPSRFVMKRSEVLR